MRIPKSNRVGILISGRGSNMMAILNAIEEGTLNAEIGVVISNRQSAGGLALANEAKIPTEVVSHRAYKDRDSFEDALADALLRHDIEVVVLAGFMRLLGSRFLARFKNRVINIHPSLLPAFPGLHAHEQALAYGTKISGCTVHLVDEGTDSGPILDQAVVPILPGDDVDSLSARILQQEHKLLPRALGWLLEGRVEVLEAHEGGRHLVHLHDA